MKLEIEIDLPEETLRDWEPVAFRKPVRGEICISSLGVIHEDTGNFAEPRLILRRRWHWPEWLTAEWIAADEGLIWYGYEHEPVLAQHHWEWSGVATRLTSKLLAFAPPDCTDWRQSKMRNPNKVQ